ncbi:MAG: hypothetical protein LBQ61_10130 [Spirochaetales bacterium]|nr:hypothetical protein [Spirochaetales bacterium]
MKTPMGGFAFLLLAGLPVSGLFAQVRMPGGEFGLVPFLRLREEAYVLGEDPVLSYVRELEFDSSGRLKSESYFNADGTPGSRILSFYDGESRLLWREFHHPGAGTPDMETFVYSPYPPYPLISLERLYTTGTYGWRFEYAYDESGRLQEIKKFDRYWKNLLVWQRRLEYDGEDRLKGETAFGQDPFIRWRFEYDYPSSGETERRIFNYRDAQSGRTVYRFNEKGHLTGETEFDSLGEAVSETRYFYRYDSRGNWTAKYIARSLPASGEAFDIRGYYLRSYEYPPDFPEP